MSNFLKNAGKYSVGSLLSVLAGIISFPILTRAFDVGDYGKFGLVAATLSILVGISKLGFNHSIVRFYSEIKAGKTSWTLDNFFSTLYIGMLSIACSVAVLWAIINYFFGQLIWQDPVVTTLLTFTSILILVRVVDSSMMNVLKAQEKAGSFSKYTIAKRYAVLATIIFCVVILNTDLINLYKAITICECIVLILFASKWIDFNRLRLPAFDKKLLVLLCTFGIPMFGMELSSVLLGVGDRYVVNALLGAEPLGLYSSSYALAEYARNVISMSLVFSATPVYLRLYAEQGAADAVAFIREAIITYCWIMIPVMFGMSAIAEPLITVLAGEKYVGGAVVIPWLVAALGLQGVITLSAAGLYLAKESKKLFAIVFFAAIANLLLNFLLLPIYGLVGAGVASFICMFGLVIASYFFSSKYLHINIPYNNIFKSLVSGGAMFVVVSYVSYEQVVISLLLKIAVGVVVYSAFIYLLDHTLRQKIKLGLK